jgi:hypothetical protein
MGSMSRPATIAKETRMESMIESVAITIPCGRTLRIRNALGVTLRVAQGTGWITEADDTEDYALSAGGFRRIGTSGLTLVHAFDDVSLAIEGSGRAAAATLELGGGYREYAAAVWREQLAGAFRKSTRGLRNALARWFEPSRGIKVSAGPR